MDWHKEHMILAYHTFDVLHRYLQTELSSDIEKELKKVGINYSTILQAKTYFDIQRAK